MQNVVTYTKHKMLTVCCMFLHVMHIVSLLREPQRWAWACMLEGPSHFASRPVNFFS